MAGRGWRGLRAPRGASALNADRPGPSRPQAAALLACILLVASAAAVASYVIGPSHARAFDLFYGSMFLDDQRAPVAVDLTDGQATVRLVAANTQVSAASISDLSVVPLSGGTLLLNSATGEFNLVDNTGFVVKTSGGGVPLPKPAGPASYAGIAAGESAFIEQTGTAGPSVYLVGQGTVQSASGAAGPVKPRAFATMPEPTSTAPGAAASANGDLWLLVGGANSRTLRQLSLPSGSDAGVPLVRTDHGSVTGTAAIGVASTDPDGSGPDSVALASATQLRIFPPEGGQRVAAVPGLRGVDQILPASNAQGRLSFLYHSAGGWSLVSSGPRGDVSGPTPLPGIPAGAALAPPAASNGELYTVQRGSGGDLWRISASGAVSPVPGAPTYPSAVSANGKAAESADFSDAYVVGRGARVIVNSPNHVLALAIFTDGSHAPSRIDKSAAVDLDAAGGAAAYTKPRPRASGAAPPPPPKPSVSDPAPPPPPPVSNKISCRTSTQIPHIPTITQAQPASRSVLLGWTYPLLDTQDCAPSTYTVTVKLVGGKAPRPPAAITVQGQTGVNLTGLFPDTHYAITLTAYLNGRGTPSAPVQITTGREGPAAPSGVHTTVDGAGNWTVTWNSCGGVSSGCVPAASWNLVPGFCDGVGLSGAPTPISVAGDPTLHQFRATFAGSDALLGRGLSFQVQGVGELGDIGATAGDGSCSYSWRPPNPAAIELSASVPGPPAFGQPSAATMRVSFTGDQAAATGGAGAQFTYQLLRGTQVVAQEGPTTATSASVTGVQAGTTYGAQVIVTPARHPQNAVTVKAANGLTISAPWPALSATATFTADPGLLSLTGTLSVRVHGLASSAADGETFDLVDGVFTCGNTTLALRKDDFDPGQDAIVVRDVSLLTYNGDCSVSGALAEDPSTVKTPSIFGGQVSGPFSDDVALGDLPPLGAGAGDFDAAWNPHPVGGLSAVVIRYTGSASSDELDELTSGWSETVLSSDGTRCGSSTQQPDGDGVRIAVSKSCVHDFGAPDQQWTVSISYHDSKNEGPFAVDVSGNPPTYSPPSSSSPPPPDSSASSAPSSSNSPSGSGSASAPSSPSGSPPSS